jgi:acetyl esterase/lipase
MKSKIVKRILSSLLIIFILTSLLMVTPRILSALFPEKPPVGYHFLVADYLAVGIGLEKMIDRKPDIPEEIEGIKNIEYKNINGTSLQLDIYKPKNTGKPAPLLVFIHGGGWRSGQRSDYLVYLVAFAKRGYITATVSYRLLKDGPYPACAQDITDAVRWFYNNSQKYGYDPDRIALIGGSAGAHLALLAAYGWKNPNANKDTAGIAESNHHIKAVVDIYGPFDLTTEYARNHPLVTSFIARSFEESPELYREASPEQYLNRSSPPTMILHGTSDELVPISQSDMLKAKLDSIGVPCVYYRLPLWPHTMDIVKRVNDFSQQKMNEFFEKYLK